MSLKQCFQTSLCAVFSFRIPGNRTWVYVLFCFWLVMEVHAYKAFLWCSSNSCCCCCWKWNRCHTLCLRVFLFRYFKNWLKRTHSKLIITDSGASVRACLELIAVGWMPWNSIKIWSSEVELQWPWGPPLTSPLVPPWDGNVWFYMVFLTTVGNIVLKFGIHAPLRMKSNYFGHPFTFLDATSSHDFILSIT